MTMRRFFEFSAALTSAPRREASDVAEITLRLGPHILSRLADTETHTTRDFFRASATAVGLWFADNWWRLRWETLADPHMPSVNWRLRHELNSAAGGTFWPPVMIYSVGERIVFAPSIGNRVVAGPQQYLDFPVSTVSAADYESEIDGFLQFVVEACAVSVDGRALAEILAQIRTERNDAELAGWRRLEACLGFDPDQAPDTVVEALIDLEGTVGEDGVEEAALARPGDDAPAVLQSVIAASEASPIEVDLAIATRIEKNPELPPNASPWRFAEEAAAELRRIIGVPQGKLVRSDFADLFKARWTDLKEATATARRLPYGARLAEDSGRDRLAMQTLTPHDRRFELARHLGDAIWSKQSSFGPVSRSRTDRQKFQRAFAQSLLCPFADVRERIDLAAPSIEQITDAARYFHVHSNVVRNLLVYKGILPFENLEQRIDAE